MLRLVIALLLTLVVYVAISRADIYRWDDGTLIPGTEGIESGPDLQLDNRVLAYADLYGSDLSGSRFNSSDLTNAHLQTATLTNADFSSSNLSDANLHGAKLTNADRPGQSWQRPISLVRHPKALRRSSSIQRPATTPEISTGFG